MTTVNYLSKTEMGRKFGMPQALGYTMDGDIYIRKGLDKKTEARVREHEAEHVVRGEEGPFLGNIVGTVVGGILNNRAARAQTDASNAAIAEQGRQYDQTREDTATQRRVGDQALNYLSEYLMGGGKTGGTSLPIKFGMPAPAGGNVPTGNVDLAAGFTTDPGYLFRMGEGEKGVTNYLRNKGLSLSGRGIKELERFRQGFASNEFGNYINRRATERSMGEQEVQNWLSRMMQLGGYGAQGINTSTSAGVNTSSNVANILQNQGNNRADYYGNMNTIAQDSIANEISRRQQEEIKNASRGFGSRVGGRF